MMGSKEGNALMERESELSPYRPMVQKTQKNVKKCARANPATLRMQAR
jgi:hypothetical protein